MMIQTVIFDIDNTLYDYDTAHAPAFQALTDYVGAHLGVTPDQFTALHRSANQILKERTGGNCAAMHNRLIRYQIILEQLGASIAHAPVMERLYWTTLLQAAQPNPGALSCLRQLKNAGIRLGIGTDMTADWQYTKLEQFGMLPLFDFMVTSEEVTDEKPGERFFHLCLEKAGCPAECCAFVGDSLKKDVAGAQMAGMRPIWFQPQGDSPLLLEGVLRVRRLDAIPRYLLG